MPYSGDRKNIEVRSVFRDIDGNLLVRLKLDSTDPLGSELTYISGKHLTLLYQVKPSDFLNAIPSIYGLFDSFLSLGENSRWSAKFFGPITFDIHQEIDVRLVNGELKVSYGGESEYTFRRAPESKERAMEHLLRAGIIDLEVPKTWPAGVGHEGLIPTHSENRHRPTRSGKTGNLKESIRCHMLGS